MTIQEIEQLEEKATREKWKILPFSECIDDFSINRSIQLPANKYSTEGKFPVVDQGQQFISGWTNNQELVIEDLPVIIFGDHTRTLKYVDFPFVLGADGTKAIKPNKLFCSLFFYYSLKNIEIPNRGYNRHYNLLKKELVCLPPLPEQRKIAKTLSTIQKAIETQDKIIANVQELKKATMERLFTKGLNGGKTKQTEIGEMPEGWEVVPIEQIAHTRSGGTPSRNNSKFYKGNVQWVKSGELNDAYIYETEESITEEAIEESSAKLLKPGTLLIALYGATTGRTGVLKIEATTNQAVCAILPKNKNSFVEVFLQNYIMRSRNSILRERYGGAQPNISQKTIQRLKVPLPTFSEQIKVAKIFQSIDGKIERHEAKKSNLQDFFKSVLDKLMKGRN